MAKQRILKSVEDAFTDVFARLRKLELRTTVVVGNWTLAEDRGTGDLVAVRDNGSGNARTVVVLATKDGT